MNKWWTLYLKAIKDALTIFGLIFTLVAGMELYAILHAGQIKGMVLSLVPLGIVITMMPLILFYLYPQEWKSDARYLLMSLPIPRFVIGMSKYLAVLSIGIVLLIICLMGISWNALHFPEWESLKMNIDLSQDVTVDRAINPIAMFQNNLWGIGIFVFSVTLYFMLGLVVAVQSVNLITRRFTFFVTILTGIGGWYIYFKLGGVVLGWLGQSNIDNFALSSNPLSTFQMFIVGWGFYTFLMGLFFLVGGLFLTEKYLEI